MLLLALASIAAGLALLSRVPVDGRYVVDLLPAMLLLGVGGGLAFPALMTLAMSSVRPEDSGLASGLVNTTQQVGGALGLAILATVAESRTGGATDRRRAGRRLQRRVHGRGRARGRGARRRRGRPAPRARRSRTSRPSRPSRAADAARARAFRARAPRGMKTAPAQFTGMEELAEDGLVEHRRLREGSTAASRASVELHDLWLCKSTLAADERRRATNAKCAQVAGDGCR